MSTAQVRAGPPPGRWDQSGGRFFRRSTAGPGGLRWDPRRAVAPSRTGGSASEQAALLEGALADAGADHAVEIYPAQHGFAVPDNPTYDTGADARHWAALEQLYRARLQG
ncbi:MAG TPA: dienelactone hydrolase family protein [Streptosporangiaceae bacterium]